jgi:hypothetical protein
MAAVARMLRAIGGAPWWRSAGAAAAEESARSRGQPRWRA